MARLITIIVLLMAAATTAQADEFAARVYFITDGDTIKIDAQLGLDVSKTDVCRMLHYNAPETRGKERPLGLKATSKLIDLLKYKNVRIVTRGRDKYNRLLCEVYLADGTDVNALMRRWLEDVLKYKGTGKYDYLERKQQGVK